MKTQLERFQSKYVVQGECWIWTAANNGKYGRFHHAKVGWPVYAHRWSYEHFVGPIPAELVVGHLCRTPLCVNPAHLEAVTQAENVARWANLITFCKWGHPYDETNTRWAHNGSRGLRRFCKSCDKRYRELGKSKS